MVLEDKKRKEKKNVLFFLIIKSGILHHYSFYLYPMSRLKKKTVVNQMNKTDQTVELHAEYFASVSIKRNRYIYISMYFYQNKFPI